METRGAAGAPPLCARPGCGHPLGRPRAGGAPRRYCSDECRSAARRERSRIGVDPGKVLPLSVIQDAGVAGPVAALRALTARLLEVADTLDTALVDAEIDAVAARVASVEAVAAEHLATRHATDERLAGMAAEEAAEVAQTLAATAAQDRDRAIAEAAGHAARALETKARTAAELERMGTLLEASTLEAQVRIGDALADAAARVDQVNARAARIRADADELIDAERGARVAAQGHIGALTGERDGLVAQIAALSAELAALRSVTATRAVPTRETAGAPRSRAPRGPRVHRPVG